MNDNHPLTTNSSARGFSIGLQPKLAWMAILWLVIPTALCLLIRFSSILQIFFPAASVIVGAFLYWRYPILYLSFTWWLWFIAPFIARVVEYQNGLTDPGLRLIILAPYLVTILTAFSFFKHFPRIYRQDGLPFVLGFIAIFYAFLVGLAKSNPITEIVQGVLSWLPGIFFGFHLLINWQDYPSYRQNTERTFLWGTLVMGIYGVVQYVVAPEWDRFWLRNSEELLLCCGWPEPLQIRVWSTLNYPFTFAYAMMASLLLLLSRQEPLVFLAIISGFMSLLLSEVRAAWGGWVIGFITIVISIKQHYQMRLIATLIVIGVCLTPLATMEPFSEVITSRLETLSNVKEDHSFNERAEIYGKLINSAVSEFNGRGMGGEKIIDAGTLDVLATLGWLGIIPFLSGIILIFLRLFQYSEARSDPFMNSARAIVLSVFITLPATNTMVLLPGVMFWGFSGMAMAAHKYHQHQRTVGLRIE
ncbi:O-antigen ligase domain-containing protein [Microcoleus sp. BR0-C5]|uniref:O-antigen ligase domain-containing protein n=1 Tax=Microcoleus sp. BR0-C5 TaxID=2818713 RepID=UPI002FD6E48A